MVEAYISWALVIVLALVGRFFAEKAKGCLSHEKYEWANAWSQLEGMIYMLGMTIFYFWLQVRILK